MMLALKLHLQTHQISSIPFTKLVRSPQSPLFQLQRIQTSSFSPLHLKSRRTNPLGFNASCLEQLNINGGGGGGVEDVRKDGGGGGGGGDGGVGEVVKLFLRGAALLWDPERAVGLPGKLAWLCAQAMWQLHLAMMEIGNVVIMCFCAGFFLVSAVITFFVFQFV